MRLHTKLNRSEIHAALDRAKLYGHVADDVQFLDTNKPDAQTYQVIAQYSSQTHDNAFEISLGVDKDHTYQPLPDNYRNQFGTRQKTRRTARIYGYWAATWEEWGWFIAEIFKADPDARWGTRPRYDGRDKYRWGYFDHADFDAKTGYKFVEDTD